jgi:hypothetical protein
MSLIRGCFKTYAHIRLLPKQKSQKRPRACMRVCAGPQGREKSLFDNVLGENIRLLNISQGIVKSLFQASCQSYPVT